MRRKAFYLVAVAILVACLFGCKKPKPVSQLNVASPGSITWEVHFSPDGGCTTALVNEINRATKSIYVQAYSFTSVPIAQALSDAARRGVHVEAILDSSNQTAKYSGATYLKNAGVPTYIDSEHAIAHNKVMIIDGETVVTGSFNFTKAAEHNNAENLLIIHNVPMAEQYMNNWLMHKSHSTPYSRLSR